MSYHTSRRGNSLTVIRSASALRQFLSQYPQKTVGFVPTMGALHRGHLSLLHEAQAECDLTVVSIFVNPTQFDKQDDLTHYPRNEEQDLTLLDQHGADVVFLPQQDEIYTQADATRVNVHGVAQPFEGTHRGSAHFNGVATVVTKLFNIVQPTVAYFGQKDAQQVAVIKQIVADLFLPVTIRTGRTIRDENGLALSSRNARLSTTERQQAQALSQALQAVLDAFWVEKITATTQLQRIGYKVLEKAGVKVEYFAIVAPETFQPIGIAEPTSLAIVAGYIDQTRLIDNVSLQERTLLPERELTDSHLYALTKK